MLTVNFYCFRCHHGTCEKDVAKGGWKKEEKKRKQILKFTINHTHPVDGGIANFEQLL